jgi:hypothetical protein
MIVAIFLVPGRLVRICQNGLLPHANLTSEGIALFNPWEGARRKMAQSRESITEVSDSGGCSLGGCSLYPTVGIVHGLCMNQQKCAETKRSRMISAGD